MWCCFRLEMQNNMPWKEAFNMYFSEAGRAMDFVQTVDPRFDTIRADLESSLMKVSSKMMTKDLVVLVFT